MAVIGERVVRLYSNHLGSLENAPASVDLSCPENTALDIEFAAFESDEVQTKLVPFDLSGVDSLRFLARDSLDVAIMDKTVLAVAFTTPTLTKAAWDAGSQHAIFQFSDVEMAITPGSYSYSIFANLPGSQTVTLVTDTITILNG